MFKKLIIIACIALFLQTGDAARTLLNPQAFDPQKCAASITMASVCLIDMWKNFGKPSAACCKALEEIKDVCLPALFPTNPLFAPFLKAICLGGGLPIPFPPIGGGAGGLPFPFPLPGVGGGATAPPPKA